VVFGTGCDQDEVARLQRENKELAAKLDSQSKLVDLDTQAKCSAAAKQYLREEYQYDNTTILLDQHNHYNRTLGKCFVMVEWHYREKASKTGDWYNVIQLHDVYQGDEYGDFGLFTMILPPDYKTDERVYTCRVNGKDCKSIEEFSSLTQHFMTD